MGLGFSALAFRGCLPYIPVAVSEFRVQGGIQAAQEALAASRAIDDADAVGVRRD